MKKETWVFGSGGGHSISDNSAAFFEYVAEKSDEVRAVWLSAEKSIVDDVHSRGYEAHLYYSARGIYLALSANSIFLSHSFFDVSMVTYLNPWRKKIVQLWHGTPLKRLENMKWPLHKRLLIKLFLLYIRRDCDYIVSSTRNNVEIYQKHFKVEEEKILLTGQPRNDRLVRANAEYVSSNKLVIWYMPTFREYDAAYDHFDGHGFDIDRLEKLLKTIDAELVVKLHPVDARKSAKTLRLIRQSDRVRLHESREDIYYELGKVDILITDYSSVFFDFLLTQRPLIYACFDIQNYTSSRGFYYDFPAVTPGEKVSNWEEVEIALSKLANGQDAYLEDRNVISKKFNEFNDANSCKRLYDTLIQGVEV